MRLLAFKLGTNGVGKVPSLLKSVNSATLINLLRPSYYAHVKKHCICTLQ